MGFPLHKPYPYSLYRWGFLHFRYLKCLVMLDRLGCTGRVTGNMCSLSKLFNKNCCMDHLVDGWATHLENMRKSNFIISPGRGENKNYLKPPPRSWIITNHNFTTFCWWAGNWGDLGIPGVWKCFPWLDLAPNYMTDQQKNCSQNRSDNALTCVTLLCYLKRCTTGNWLIIISLVISLQIIGFFEVTGGGFHVAPRMLNKMYLQLHTDPKSILFCQFPTHHLG